MTSDTSTQSDMSTQERTWECPACHTTGNTARRCAGCGSLIPAGVDIDETSPASVPRLTRQQPLPPMGPTAPSIPPGQSGGPATQSVPRTWDCPSCGMAGNTGRRCVRCEALIPSDAPAAAAPAWAAVDGTAAARQHDAEHGNDPQALAAVRERYELNPVALGIALLGAALTVVGLFLPAYENSGFLQVENNRLIQQGVVVWTVVIFGVVLIVDLARAYQQHRRPSWGALTFPVSVGISTALLLKGTTVYPVVGGVIDQTAAGTHAAAGTGVYVVLAGAVICALGIFAMRQNPGRQLRQCPACAETVLAEATVCKHCGSALPGALCCAGRRSSHGANVSWSH